jgi:mycothiol synthase
MAISIRNYGPDDFDRYVELVMGPDELAKPASTRWVKEQLGKPDRDPERDVFLAEDEGVLVGYVNILGSVKGARLIVEGRVDPSHRHRGVGTMLLQKAIASARTLGARAIQIPVLDEMTGGRQVVEKEGFSVVRTYWSMELEAEPAKVTFPRPFVCREFMPGDEEALAAIHNRVFGSSWGFRTYSVADVSYRIQMDCCRPEGIFLATDNDTVVGYCWTKVEEGYARDQSLSGSVWLLGVDGVHRRRGLGQALLTTGIYYLRGLGITPVRLTVDSRNDVAIAMFQRLGFRKREGMLWYERQLAQRGIAPLWS